MFGYASALLAAGALADPGRYLDAEAFVRSAFPERAPTRATLWLTDEIRAPIEHALGRRLAVLRIQYWQAGHRTAWILDEIGKEEPITIGVVVDEGAVEMVRVLEFRESRGWEVRYPFFTDQFSGARIASSARIDKHIDNITGATLSVGAVNRVVQTALLLHERALRDPS